MVLLIKVSLRTDCFMEKVYLNGLMVLHLKATSHEVLLLAKENSIGLTILNILVKL